MSEKKRISEKISDLNLKNILAYLIRNPKGVARTELCKNLHVSFPAVSSNVKKLMEQGLVLEEEQQLENGSVGRNPKIICLNKEYGIVVAVHVGYKTVEISLLNMMSSVIYRRDFEISKRVAFEELINILTNEISEALSVISLTYDTENLVGVSIALPGIIDNETSKLMSSKFYNWQDVDLPDSIKINGYETNLYWENDSNVLASGIFYKNPELENILAFYMGVGIGIGIFINKKLYSGSRGMAGEMGNITFPMGEETVSLEKFISEESLVSFARENLGIENQSFTETLKMMDDRFDDKKVRENLKIVSNYVGNFFAILLRAFDPQKIAFDGTVVRNCPNLSKMIADKLMGFTDISEDQICIANGNENTIIKGLYSITVGKSLGLEEFGG